MAKKQVNKRTRSLIGASIRSANPRSLPRDRAGFRAVSTPCTAKRRIVVEKHGKSRKFKGSDTLAVHAGQFPAIENVPSSPALYQASSYEFDDLDDVEAIYGGTRPGAIYGRYGGPNALHFESAMADLESAEAAVGAASGMAAIGAALATSLKPGQPLLAASDLYGGTLALLENDFQERGNRTVFLDVTGDFGAIEAALIRERPPVLYVEAASNPLVRIPDLPELVRLAHAHGAIVVVDATFVSPALGKPLEMGADLVLHSVGKYLGGHGDVGAGVVAGDRARIERIRAYLVRTGATLPHFEAWLALRGVRTLALRMARHSANAAAVAGFLAGVPAVARVHHPSRPDHPQHALAERLYPGGTGGIVAFDLHGTRETVAAFVRGLETIAIVHSLGEVATTLSYPAVSSHRPLAPEARAALGVTETTLRLSCGIEDARDIIADLDRAFAGLSQTVPATEVPV
jgi:cystathionine beta-lyase/cystathionine gamma-synthase